MDIETLYHQAAAAQKSGDLVLAETRYRQLIALSPVPEMLVNHGNVLAALGRRDAALASYERALAARPALPEALFNRGNLLLEMKRPEAALASYDQLLATRRDHAGLWNNRGTALRALRRLEQALASYDEAVALNPGHVNAMTNRAMALWDLKRLDQALAACDRMLALQPGFAEAHHVRANVLRDMGRADEALAAYEQVLAANPRHPHALNGIAQTARVLCDWPRADTLAPRLRAAVETGAETIQPFVLMGYSDDAALLRRCAENYIRRNVPPQPPLWDGRAYGHDRIRLAYLSADFHTHPTALLMAELFERHDRARFEVSALAFGPDDGSAMRARLVKAFDRFLDVRDKSDREVALLLREMEIDIAVDLNGHTHGARTGIFAFRACPVQVNYLVYPGTIGADFMDWIIADTVVLPPNHEGGFREKVARLADCYQANDATRIVPPPQDTATGRAQAGLPPEGFVFCCFNAGWKITAPVFDIWMRLLTGVPGSVLWLLDGPHAANLRHQAQARGMDAGRLVFAPHLPPDAHLARHALADLFLDTLPYNAHTTASDSLSAGVPLVTCVGKAFPGRVAASLLKAVGLPELVTNRPEDYEALALELARDAPLLKATREKLLRNRLVMPLYDSERFRRGIEARYESFIA